MHLRFQVLFVYYERSRWLDEKEGYPPLAINELQTLTSLPIEAKIGWEVVTPLSVRLMPAEEALTAGHSWQRPGDPGIGEHLAMMDGVAYCDLEALNTTLRDQGQDYSREKLTEAARSVVGTDLQKFAGDFVLASAIAVPGALHPVEIHCIVEGNPLHHQRLNPSMVDAARAEFSKTGWPTFAHLPLSEAISWLRRIPGFEEGVPSGDLGRGVAALSRLLGYEVEAAGSELMWAMIGLEALYLRGREGLTEQLREKVETLLGAPDVDRKRFQRLYAYRSQFVHGGLDVPLAYTPYDAVEAFMHSELKTFHSALTGTALLVATLQRMLQDNRVSLKFRWVLDPA